MVPEAMMLEAAVSEAVMPEPVVLEAAMGPEAVMAEAVALEPPVVVPETVVLEAVVLEAVQPVPGAEAEVEARDLVPAEVHDVVTGLRLEAPGRTRERQRRRGGDSRDPVLPLHVTTSSGGACAERIGAAHDGPLRTRRQFAPAALNPG